MANPKVMLARYEDRKQRRLVHVQRKIERKGSAWAARNSERLMVWAEAAQAVKIRHWRPLAERYAALQSAYSANRRERVADATPPWASIEALCSIYEECHRLTVATGQQYHVDHIVPLKNQHVCGLHVPWNLKAIPAIDNLRKSNRFTPG